MMRCEHMAACISYRAQWYQTYAIDVLVGKALIAGSWWMLRYMLLRILSAKATGKLRSNHLHTQSYVIERFSCMDRDAEFPPGMLLSHNSGMWLLLIMSLCNMFLRDTRSTVQLTSRVHDTILSRELWLSPLQWRQEMMRQQSALTVLAAPVAPCDPTRARILQLLLQFLMLHRHGIH